MRSGSTVMSALLGITFLQMLLPGPIHVAYWRMLVAALAGAAATTGIAWVGDAMRFRRRTRGLSR